MIFSSDPAYSPTHEDSIPAVRGRMEGAFLSASREGRPVSLMILGADDLEQAADREDSGEEALMEALRARLEVALEGRDVPIHVYAEGAHIVALLEMPLAEAEAVGHEIVLKTKRLPFDGRSVRLALSAGLAENRTEIELFFETLILVAEEGLAVARARGGGCCVHTMLYHSLQEMKERDEGDFADSPKASRQPAKTVHSPRPTQHSKEPAPAPRTLTLNGEIGAEEEIRRRATTLAEAMAADAVADIQEEFEKRLNEARKELELSEGSPESIELLRLRIRKLSESLGKTEERLAHVCRMKGLDTGISSIYREVQGLSDSDSNQSVKKEMMKGIFLANLAMQHEAGLGRKPFSPV
ncbi:MAG: hypothetical protein CMJ89_01030 [Planctomycetes bacterium]|jgi:GGDEF domain-containing protein|nr:hypothetical protein [Planctomycetota bacterium]